MARTFTVGEVENAARLILLDTYADAYRFEPKEIFAATANAIDNIRLARPASRYVGGNIVDYSLDVANSYTAAQLETARAEGIGMERRWMEAVTYYVVYRMYLKDDPDTTNANLASKYLELYNAALGG